MRPPDRREVALLAGVMAVMLWSRMRNHSAFRVGGELLLGGNDAWYHWRATQWTAANWPRTLSYDVMTSYPTGTTVGQFGTPFDLLGATVGLVAGLGDVQAGMWAVLALPAVLGAFVALPVYGIAASVSSKRAAAASAVAIGLSTGTFFYRSTFGFYDHHVMEVLLQVTIVAILVGALGESSKARAIARTSEGAARLSSLAGFFAGLVVVMYVMVWPPAVYFIGLASAGLLAGAIIEYAREAPDWRHPLRAGFWLSVPPAIHAAAVADLSAVTLTSLGALHLVVPVSTLIAFSWATVGFWAADEADWPSRRIVAGFVALLPVAGLAAALADPTVRSWADRALAGGSARTQTIAEAQSVGLLDAPGFLLSQYGLIAVLGVVGLLVLLNRPRPRRVLVAVWLLGTLTLALGQVRSNYYLAPALAVAAGPAAAVLASRLVDGADAARPDAAKLVIAVLLVSAAAMPAAGSLGSAPGPGNAVNWQGTLQWMESETPEPDMDYHGTYEPGDFDYADRSYGVLSWWDYGHWLMERARRPAVANPFQQNAAEASLYFTAESEEDAERALDGLNMSKGEEIRYVVVDDLMATGKFGAMAVWAGEEPGSYHQGASYSPKYSRTMTAKLYHGDASGLSHHRLVYESRETAVLAGIETAIGDPISRPRRMSSSQAQSIQQSLDYRLASPKKRSVVKVFERVEGATIAGPANGSTVTVALQLRTNTGRSFVYEQSVDVEDGRFSIVVPYSSEQDGAVQAIGPYQLRVDGKDRTTFWVNETDVRSGDTVSLIA